MRRNVRRLNREIGNHGSSLPVSTQVSLPLTLPTSYQPRSQEKKIISNMKSTVQMAPDGIDQQQPQHSVMDMSYSMSGMGSMPMVDNNGGMSMSMGSNNVSELTGNMIPFTHSPQQMDMQPERKSLVAPTN